ncbi:Minor extracellular protease vpr [Ceratobasidium theobromae]|uniref:Minor extracellular protease vpr n=1 Tax=Ceratobasidium theobromae TaxID=1582974 RepID=A0A5N5QAG5_9AGAM|nr:Minor extracellular protease vpr [Ceratobasidium theobromae]
MRVFSATIACAQLVAAAVDIKSIQHKSSAQVVRNSFIIELKPGHHLKRGFESPQALLYDDLDRWGTVWTVVKEYFDPLFTGAAVTLGSDADLIKLAQVASVEAITPIYLHPAPRPVSKYILSDTVDASRIAELFTTHVMTGVDKLHAEGYFGKGISIGIIDTGVDYTHPALGSKFGPGNKVVGGYDFVGDAFTGRPGSPAAEPDNDPLDQCNGHGTHVAGIIGADPNSLYNISGVAYESDINAYRIFGCSENATVPDDILIDSLLRANKDGNDVITLSLGGIAGWTESATSVVASRIADQGKIVTIAAGNEGEYGSWYASGPGTGLSVISVGSVNNAVAFFQNATASNGRLIPYKSLTPLPAPSGLQLYATSTNVTIDNDACDPLPASTPNLADRLVIIHRGTCTFITKLTNAAAFGAKYFLIYNNVDEPLNPIETKNFTATFISQADGKFLVQEGIPQNLTVSFSDLLYTVTAPSGGLMSLFSTYGPTNDMYLKPAISAPGGDIPSTYPVPLGSYALFSGTSMATPFVAGSSALLLQIRGKTSETAKAARAIFENTAVPVMQSKNDTSLIQTTSLQGAGLIQVYDAIKGTGSLLPAEILLNDTAYFKGTHMLWIKNGGKEAITYTFSHVPAGTANTLTGIENNPGPVGLVSNAAYVTIDPCTLYVPAGWTLPVIASFEPPIGLNASNFPVYSGYIKATGSDNSTLRSTYIGVAAQLKDMQVLDNTDAFFGVKLPFLTDANGDPVAPDGNATFTLNNDSTPAVIFRLVAGSPLFRVDLADSKTNVTTNARFSHETEEQVIETTNLYSTLCNYPVFAWLFHCKTLGGTFEAVKTLGVLYEQDYIPRNSPAKTAEDNGFSSLEIKEFANGTAIPDGSYKFLLRVLRITGDPTREEDYEVWTSPESEASTTRYRYDIPWGAFHPEGGELEVVLRKRVLRVAVSFFFTFGDQLVPLEPSQLDRQDYIGIEIGAAVGTLHGRAGLFGQAIWFEGIEGDEYYWEWMRLRDITRVEWDDRWKAFWPFDQDDEPKLLPNPQEPNEDIRLEIPSSRVGPKDSYGRSTQADGKPGVVAHFGISRPETTADLMGHWGSDLFQVVISIALQWDILEQILAAEREVSSHVTITVSSELPLRTRLTYFTFNIGQIRGSRELADRFPNNTRFLLRADLIFKLTSDHKPIATNINLDFLVQLRDPNLYLDINPETFERNVEFTTIAKLLLKDMGMQDVTYLELRSMGGSFACGRCGRCSLVYWDDVVAH